MFSWGSAISAEGKISYEFKTQDVNAFERYVKAGLSPKCYDFDTVYRRYVNAKNGYEVPQGNGPDRYIAPDPQREAELKKELLTWLGHRAQSGKLVPFGFLKTNTFFKE